MKKYFCPVCVNVVAWIRGKPEEAVMCNKCETLVTLEELLKQWEEGG